MAEEKKEPMLENETPDVSDYINTIQKLKENSISREKYDKLEKNNKQLLEALANGTQVSVSEAKVATDEEVNRLRKELFNINNPMSNLEYMTKSLELRDALLSRGEADPFLPTNKDYIPNEEDQEKVEAIVSALKQTIEYCDGDAQLFNSELKRIAKA